MDYIFEDELLLLSALVFSGTRLVLRISNHSNSILERFIAKDILQNPNLANGQEEENNICNNATKKGG